MKISVSVSEEDVALLDGYAQTAGLRSRSAAVQHAIDLLRNADLGDAYAAAWGEWGSSEDGAAWEGTVGDGLVDASR